FYKVAPHYYSPGWWEGGSMLFAFVNLDKWNALPKYYQAVLTQAGHYANTWMMAKYDQLNPPALKRLLAGGTKLHVFSQPIMEVYDSMTDWTTNGYQWFQVAELTYDSFMVRHSR